MKIRSCYMDYLDHAPKAGRIASRQIRPLREEEFIRFAMYFARKYCKDKDEREEVVADTWLLLQNAPSQKNFTVGKRIDYVSYYVLKALKQKRRFHNTLPVGEEEYTVEDKKPRKIDRMRKKIKTEEIDAVDTNIAHSVFYKRFGERTARRNLYSLKLAEAIDNIQKTPLSETQRAAISARLAFFDIKEAARYLNKNEHAFRAIMTRILNKLNGIDSSQNGRCLKGPHIDETVLPDFVQHALKIYRMNERLISKEDLGNEKAKD